MQFVGEIKDGKLIIHNREVFNDFIKSMQGIVHVKIAKPKDVRSLAQNTYYWSILTYISKDTGEDPVILHETFKARFLRKEGKLFEVVGSTTDLSRKEFIEYVGNIRTLMMAYDIYLPDWEHRDNE